MGQYVNPVPHGQRSRVDMGVDFSGAGSEILAIAPSRMVGFTQGWPMGPMGYFQILGTNDYWYAAESINWDVHPGQTVSKGQRVGTIGSGSIEVGWAAPDGNTLSVAHGTSGQKDSPGGTPEGQDFLKRVILGGGGAPPGAGGGITRPGGSTDTGAQIDALFDKWQGEINMPRAVPKSTPGDLKNPLKWWFKSFSGRYGAE